MSRARTRVKVKETPITRRQAAAEFGRKKAKLRRQQSHKRYLLIGCAALVLSFGAGSWWMIHSGKFEQATAEANANFWQWTADIGFRLDQVTLTGRTHSDAKTVTKALGIKQGDPILGVSLAELKTRLESVAEIKTVTIERRLPNQIFIAVTERVPAALWQYEGNLQLIDREGVVLSREKYPEKLALPTVVGADAPKHMDELMALLDTVPSLKMDVAAAVRVGSRRWNIQLTRGIVIMLPEDEPVAAWKRFASLVETKELLTKAIKSVDMRMEDRIFIMPVEEKKSPITLTNMRDI